MRVKSSRFGCMFRVSCRGDEKCTKKCRGASVESGPYRGIKRLKRLRSQETAFGITVEP